MKRKKKKYHLSRLQKIYLKHENKNIESKRIENATPDKYSPKIAVETILIAYKIDLREKKTLLKIKKKHFQK